MDMLTLEVFHKDIEFSKLYQKQFDEMNERNQHAGAEAGIDIYAEEDATLVAGQQLLIKTGLQLRMPKWYFALVAGRSWLALREGISVLGGVIDNTYTWEVGVILHLAHGAERDGGEERTYKIKSWDRIAQLLILNQANYFLYGKATHGQRKSKTTRGDKWFGSSGK